MLPEYFDYNATTPVDPEVADIVYHYMVEEFGNAGSRTHEYGTRAAKAVQVARKQVAEALDTDPEDVIFTSGATESNNLAILGLERALTESGRTHVITSLAEHKAVLEPFEELERRGFEVTWLHPNMDGFVPPEALQEALRHDTGLVSLMHVNNETGIIQPLEDYAAVLADHSAYFHVDGAQGFCKDIERLRNRRIDLISISGHKIFAPKGIGALKLRYRAGEGRVPVKPLMFGGGQERGMRPGTLATALIVGLGKAAELLAQRTQHSKARLRTAYANALCRVRATGAIVNGNPDMALGTTLNVSFPGIDAEAIVLLLRDQLALSTGSACTSASFAPSHVLKAMKLPSERIGSAIRISWSPLMTDDISPEVLSLLESLTEHNQ